MVNRDLEAYMDTIHQRDFFKNLSVDELNEIKIHAVIHQYRKNQILFFQDDDRRYGYYLLKGLIKLEKTDDSGEYLYIDYVKENSYFPFGDFFGESNYHYNGVSVTDIDLMMIPSEILERICASNQQQLLFMYEHLADILVYTERRIQMTTISSATDRVKQMLALWMLDMGQVKQNYNIVPYPLTINELAVVAGTTRETAGRVVKSLSREGKLDFNRQCIQYLDVDYFDQLLKF